jgi:hypothetical protein
MTLTTKLLMIGSAIGAVMLIKARRRASAGAGSGRATDLAPADLGAAADRGASTAPVPAGISEVDPQPLTQVAAEAIDPEATQAAHEVIVDQRERLPVPGKNLP